MHVLRTDRDDGIFFSNISLEGGGGGGWWGGGVTCFLFYRLDLV